MKASLTNLTAILVCGLVLSARAGGAGNARSVKDLVGRNLTVPEQVDRIVALGPGALRLVAYLGAVDRIVGIEDTERRMVKAPWFRPYASVLGAEFFRLPVVGPGGPGKMPDFERIMTCRPDIVVVVGLDVGQLKNIQARTGIPVVCLSYGALGVWREDARRSLTLMGDILGRRQRAEEINAYVDRIEEDLRRRTGAIPESKAPDAYFGGISFKGAHGLTSTEAGYPPARMANASNLADEPGKKGHLFVDKEQLLVWNPDAIFIDIGSRAIVEQDFEKNREFYRLLKAARSDRVFSLLPYNYYNTNIEIALLNAYFIGKCLYPEQFRDLDIRAKAAEVFRMFLGVGVTAEVPAYGVVTFPDEGPVQWKQQ